MNKKLLQTINSALGRTKTSHYAPVTIDALQARGLDASLLVPEETDIPLPERCRRRCPLP